MNGHVDTYLVCFARFQRKKLVLKLEISSVLYGEGDISFLKKNQFMTPQTLIFLFEHVLCTYAVFCKLK